MIPLVGPAFVAASTMRIVFAKNRCIKITVGVPSFGENVGILTQEVFNLEVTESGFHKFLKNAVAGSANYEDAITMFNNRLGLEAKAILRSLFFQKENESNT